MYFDSHAHYDDKAYDKDRADVLGKLPEQGVSGIINAASSVESLPLVLGLAREYSFIYCALGIHPCETAHLTEEILVEIKNHSLKRDETKVVAIGEVGLDYHWKKPAKEVQQSWFARQIELAKAVKLPVIVHSRDAAQNTLAIMQECDASAIGGVMHCFAYSVEMAHAFIAMNFHIGIGGVATFANAVKVKEVIAAIPLESILLETDCPYLAPMPYRGKRNSSAYLSYIVDAIAAIKGISHEEVATQTTANVKRLFAIK
ncbi:MAG: TatD family hydrolase [Lachnospiraceae bacterium]|jgi:TatD DNase family protein|nr:TatD family hydrolase [Lachnospiraceae bacterium]